MPLMRQNISFPLVGGINTNIDEKLLPSPNMSEVVNMRYDDVGTLERRLGFKDISSMDESNKIAITVDNNPRSYNLDPSNEYVNINTDPSSGLDTRVIQTFHTSYVTEFLVTNKRSAFISLAVYSDRDNIREESAEFLGLNTLYISRDINTSNKFSDNDFNTFSREWPHPLQSASGALSRISKDPQSFDIEISVSNSAFSYFLSQDGSTSDKRPYDFAQTLDFIFTFVVMPRGANELQAAVFNSISGNWNFSFSFPRLLNDVELWACAYLPDSDKFIIVTYERLTQNLRIRDTISFPYNSLGSIDNTRLTDFGFDVIGLEIIGDGSFILVEVDTSTRFFVSVYEIRQPQLSINQVDVDVQGFDIELEYEGYELSYFSKRDDRFGIKARSGFQGHLLHVNARGDIEARVNLDTTIETPSLRWSNQNGGFNRGRFHSLSGEIFENTSVGSSIITYAPYLNLTATGDPFTAVSGFRSIAKIERRSSRKYSVKSYLDNSIIDGGVPAVFFENEVNQIGYNSFPAAPTVTLGVPLPPGQSLPPGIYNYVVVLERSDGNGDVIRSAPSLATTFNNPGDFDILIGLGPNERTITGLGSNLPISNWIFAKDVTFAIYRTEINGSIPKLVRRNRSIFIASSDIIPNDNDLGEILYTEGGELGNEPTPYFQSIEVWGERIFGSSAEMVWFSKIKEEGIGPEFNRALSFSIIGVDSDITGQVGLDNVIAILTEDSIHAVSGNGPDSIGRGSFSSPQLIARGIGCVSSSSIIRIPEGAFFNSKKGLYFISRNLDIMPVGVDVENITQGKNVFSPQVFQENNEVSWLLTEEGNNATISSQDYDGITYNYYHRLWYGIKLNSTVDNNYTSLGVSDEGYVLYSNASDKSALQDGRRPSPYLDDNASNGEPFYRFVTPWIHISAYQGFQRVVWTSIMGRYLSDFSFTADFQYDYESDGPWINPRSFTITSATSETNFLRAVHMAPQECTSFRARITLDDTDLTPDVFNQAMATFTELQFTLGIKDTTAKLPATKRR